MRKIIALVAVVVGCATLGLRAVAEDALSPIMTVIDAEDSVHVRLSWKPVRDARGDAVQHYVASVLDRGVIVASGTTTDTVFSAALQKIAGDTMQLVGEVYAVDVRGRDGAVGRTPTFTVIVPDPGPPAPEVRLDTIPLASAPQIDSMRMFFPVGEFDGQGRVALEIGDTLQGCVIAWRSGVAFRPTNQASICLESTFPAMLYRPMLNGAVVRQAE